MVIELKVYLDGNRIVYEPKDEIGVVDGNSALTISQKVGITITILKSEISFNNHKNNEQNIPRILKKLQEKNYTTQVLQKAIRKIDLNNKKLYLD